MAGTAAGDGPGASSTSILQEAPRHTTPLYSGGLASRSHIRTGELQSPGTGPFFGSRRSDTLGTAGRKHGPVPFCFDFAVLLH
jgi:hypothetical protein